MAIFGILDSEDIVQIGEKIRLFGDRSFVSKDENAITLVEINPEDTVESFVDVTGANSDDWFLDWVYSGTSRSVTVVLRITAGVSGPVTFSKAVQVNTEADDNLFSTDDAIMKHETELKDLIPEGKTTFNYAHRKAKELILDWFNEIGYRDFNVQKLTDAAFVEKDEVRRYSEMWTLALIYKDLSNSIGDKFDQKASLYKQKAMDARNRLVFRLDLNGDGNIDDGEAIFAQTRYLRRR